jgi:hypothetical protein
MNRTAVDKAKSSLIGRIVDEAKREGVVLSDVEVRMLGFAEASASPKEMEADQIFEQEFDDEQYEARITKLIRNVYDRDCESGRKPEWDQWLDEISEEDLYLSVILEEAGLLRTTSSLRLPDWRLLLGIIPILIFVALALFVAFTPLAARWLPNDFLRLGLCLLLLVAPFVTNKISKRRT